MSWIETIGYAEANPQLKRMYDRVKGPEDNVDNVLLVHSLRPHTLTGHMTLYKAVLHNSGNQLPKWYLEALGTYVSHLNQCAYCKQHHFAGFKRLLQDDDRANAFWKAVKQNRPADFFEGRFLLGALHARKLTLDLGNVSEEDVKELRKGGFSDGEILEINQVTSYFNYVNRSVIGLGVSTVGDVIGLSPGDSDDPGNWSHS